MNTISMILRYILITITFIILGKQSFAQETKQIENRYYSLKDSLRKNHNLSKQFLLKELSYIVNRSENYESLDSIKLRCWAWKASVLRSSKQKDSFMFYTHKFIDYFKEDPKRLIKYPDSYGDLVQPISSNLVEMGHYNQAFEIVRNAITQLEKHEYKGKGLTSLYLTLGYIEMSGLSDKNKAKKTFKKVLSMAGNDSRKHFAYSALGNLYMSKNLDSAQYYKQKACENYKNYAYKGRYQSCRSTLAHILLKKGNLEKAKEILKEVITFKENSQASEDPTFLAWSYYYKSKIYQYEGDLLEQEKYLLRSNKILQDIKDTRLSEDVNYLLSLLYYRKGDFKQGYDYELKSITARDSVFSQNKMNAVQEMSTKYEVEKKEHQLASQLKIVSIQKSEKNKLLIGLLVLTLLLLTSTYFYIQKIKAQKELLSKQEILNQHEINSILENNKLSSLQSYLNGQNKERERIARDLHDGVSGNLAAIKLKLSSLQDQMKEIKPIIKNVDKTYNDIRSISHDLMPKQMQVNSFIAVLNQLIKNRQTSKLTIASDLFPKEGLEKLPVKIQLGIYRLCQEIFTNILKHAKASKIFVTITMDDNYVNIKVEDNGVGFNPKIQKIGLGLKNMNKRVQELSGILNIESSLNKGTTVHIKIPIGEKNNKLNKH